MSVVFDFNASLIDFAPVSPMLHPVDLLNMEKKGLLVYGSYVLFLLSSLLKSIPVSVVFDFNASLNDAAPLSPRLFSVEMKLKKWKQLTPAICVVSFVFTTQIELSECCV